MQIFNNGFIDLFNSKLSTSSVKERMQGMLNALITVELAANLHLLFRENFTIMQKSLRIKFA